MASQNKGKSTKIAFYTLGCKVNRYETQMLAERFAALGFEVVEPEEKADVYVINSCTVTGIADRKSRNFARRSKRANPDALTVLAGCCVETAAERLKGMAEVDMLVGNADKARLPELLAGASAASGAARAVGTNFAEDGSGLPDEGGGTAPSGYRNGITGLAGRARAYIKIEDGCDRFCAFCIVPKARGGVRSRALPNIVEEARALIANGYRELVLTGVNAALYDSGGRGVIDVVDAVSKIGGDFRIRLSSLEPTVIDAAYANELVKRERLCPHLHLSVQSGADPVLRAMRRGYTMGDYLRITDALKKRDPLFSITTDIIAGFPGETEADHKASLDAVRKIGFSRIHVFRYSPRPGTPAAEMDGRVPPTVKAERSRELIAEGEKAAEAFLRENVGSRRRVLFYGPAAQNVPDEEARSGGTAGPHITCRGITDNGIEVQAESAADLSNTFKSVRLTEQLVSGRASRIDP